MVSLHKRKSIYYVIITIPADIQASLRKKQVWKSTGATKYVAAKSVATQLIATSERIFSGVRLGMITTAMANEMLARFALLVLATDEARYNGELSGSMDQAWSTLDSELGYDFRESEASQLITVAEHDKREVVNPKGLPVKRLSTLLLKSKKIELDPDSTEFTKFNKDVAKTKIAINKVRAERLLGEYDTDFQHRKITEWQAAIPVPVDKGILVTDLLKRYSDYRMGDDVKESDQWTPEQAVKMGRSFKRLMQYLHKIFGKEPRVKDVTPAVARQVYNALRNQPKYKKKESDEGLKVETLRGYMFKWGQPFAWGAEPEQKYTDSDPFSSLAPPKQGSTRREFTKEELQLYFNLLADRHDAKRPEMTWIPLIAAYTGFRTNEIAQLHCKDIKTDTSSGESIETISVVVDTKTSQKTKNKTAVRDVPIHSTLIELGLLKFLKTQKEAGHLQLFPNLEPETDSGRYYAAGLSQELNNNLDLVLDDPNVVVYCLRNSFENGLEHKFALGLIDAMEGKDTFLQSLGAYAPFLERARNDLLGHAQKGSTGDKVYRKARLKVMKRVIEQLDYDIDLDKLREKFKTLVG